MSKTILQRGWLPLFFFLPLLCDGEGNPTLEETVVVIKGHSFTVELARTDEERALGLMYREEMPADHGMLFIYASETSEGRAFYMKNTLIPLSIAYLDRNGVIREIIDMQPLDETPHPASWPMQYALELNQGRFRELGITVGDRVEKLP